MPQLTGKKGRVADLLFELGAIKFGAFKLKLHEKQPEAPLSPIYLNLRTDQHPKNPGPLTQEVMHLVGDLFAEIKGIAAPCYADIPEAGAPFGDQWQRVTAGWPQGPNRLHLFKEEMPDGTRHITKRVEGEFQEHQTCLVIDELITHADSKLEAIRALEAAGLVVVDVLVLVDRMQGGSRQLQAAGYILHAVLTLDELLDHYLERGFIDSSKAEEVRQYIAANQAA